MIKYICKKCNTTGESSECGFCHERTEILESSIYYCKNCNIPLFDCQCSICKNSAMRLTADIRPVFPEERLLIEILLGEPLKYKNSSVWCGSNSTYYVEGKKIPFALRKMTNIDPDYVREELEKYKLANEYTAFEENIRKFIQANKRRYDFLVNDATEYIRSKTDSYKETEMFVSFSGGKDSTVVSDLVMRALSTQKILHIYGDTTLEFPETEKYVARFKKEHRKTLVLSSRNKNKEFTQLCEQLGPPSRVMRWCCTIFKTGAIQRKIDSVFKNNKRILTFYGIRRSESASRSKYDKESDSPKITRQKTVSPIIDWTDFDVWLYILTSGIDFNTAYRLGYTRVGCWCCPNNGAWSEFLSKIYMPEQYKKFHNMLLDFAVKIGKPDPEVYVNDGKWKARQGGNGLSYSQKSVLNFEPCALQENTLNFELARPINDELYELFKPFGYLDKALGNPRLGEVYILDKAGNMLLKLTGKIGTHTLKVSILTNKIGKTVGKSAIEKLIMCQITKYQMCMGCLACESVCMMGAIKIETDKTKLLSYTIDNDKCVRCMHCVNHFNGGCYIRKVMCIRRR